LGHRVYLKRSQNSKVAIMTTSSKTKPETVNRNGWRWGFTPQAESWNGRFAMLGFVAMLLTELLSNQGVLHFYNLMQTVATVAPVIAK
jgi:Chlorophyll A-B binding protein